MRRGYLYFLVGLWTLLLGGLAVWSAYVVERIDPGTRVTGAHRLAENLGILLVWALMVGGTFLVHFRMSRQDRERGRLASELTASEERWRSALAAIGDGLWDWNVETDDAFFSPTALRMFGFEPEEIPGRMVEWRDRVHADDQAATTAELAHHLAGDTEAYQTEHRIRCKDGSYKWALVRGRVVARAPDGRARRMIGTTRDLSKIHETEQQLRESETRYRHLLASITDYVFTVELAAGHEQRATHSPGCLAVTGYSTAEFAARPGFWFELVPAEHQAIVQGHWAAALAGEPVAALEHPIRHKDGSIRWVRGTLVPRRDAAGGLIAIDGLVQDVTAAKRMETELRESEARYRLIAENTGDVIWLLDLAANRFSYVSPSIVKLCGVTPDEALQLGLERAVPAEFLSQVTSRLAARIEALVAGDESARTRSYELPLQKRDGSVVDTEVVTTLITNASGRATHLQGATRDITVRKRTEAELQRVRQWLEHTQRISRVGGWAFNLTTGSVWASPEARRIYGLGDGELTRADIMEIPLAEYRPVLDRALRDLVEHGVPYDLEFRIRRRTDGAILDLHSLAERGPDGTTALGVIQDITERKRADIALHESEARLAATFEAIHDLIFVLDRDGRFVEAHCPKGVELFVPPAEFLGKPYGEIMPPAVAGQLTESLRALAITNEAQHFDYELALGGEVVWWSASVSRRTDHQGTVTGAVVVCRDITARKRAERALRESEEKFYQAFHHAPLLMVVSNLANGHILEANALAQKVSGFDPQADLGRNVVDLGWFTAAERAQLVELLQTQGHVTDLELVGRKRDGGTIDCLVNCQLVTIGGETRVITTVQDISERKRAEQALREGKRELDLFFNQSLEGFFFATFDEPVVWNDGTNQEAVLDYVLTHQRLTRANEALIEQYGATREQLLGRTPAGFMTGDALTKRSFWRRLLDAGRLHAETAGRKIDGTPLQIEGNYICLYDAAGRVTGYFGVQRDITTRVRSETALRESWENYLGLFNTVSDAIYVHGADGVFLDVNEGAARMYGYGRDELVGRTPASVAAPGRNDLEAVRRMLAEVFATGRPATFEFWGLRKDGEAFPKACVSHRGKYFGRDVLITTARDITAQRRAEEALAQSEHMLRESQKVAALGSYVMDLQTGEWRSSAILDEIFGIDASFDRTTAGWASLVAPAEQVAMVDYFTQEVLGKGASFDRQYRIVRANDGAERWVHGIGKLTFDAAHRPVSMFGTIQDITERKRAELALRESEERYRTLVELSPEAVFVHDRGKLLFANRAALRLAAASSLDELRGADLLQFVHPESREVVERRIRETAVDGRVTPPIRQKWHRLNGELIEVAVVATRVMFDGASATLVIAMDMTAQRLAEAELRKLLRAVEQSPVTVVITDAAGAIEYVNPSFTAKTGYSLDEVRGANSRILRSGETSRETYRDLWQTILSGHEWRGEFHNRKKNGELFWEAATISPITDESGRITHFLAVKEDITEHKLAEDRIREQAALLDVAQDAILVLSLDRVIMFWNRGAEKLYGIGSEQALGRRYETVAYRELPADYDADWRSFLERGVWSVERRHVAPGRGEITVQKRATLVRDAQGNAKSVLLVVTDITEAKRLEAQFLRAQRLDSLGSLASGVAHDLNNVLTPILMSAGMLAETARTKSERELIQLLSDSARRGADIVQQLLLYGRGSDSPRSPMSVAAAIKDMVKMMRETFPKGIAITAEVPRDLWMIDGDRTQIHQVLLNFCVNARDAMPAGGSLSVVAENVNVDPAFAERQTDAQPGPHVTIRVKDTGTGIAAEHLEKIFDPFFTTKPTGKGTGLGLATVLGIVRSHGGFVTVETQPGVGSEFGVFLPARPSVIEEAAAGSDRPGRRGHGELVLVIDDETSIRTTLEKILVAHGYEVLVAGDGAEGLAVFVQNAKKIRLVITDMMMPVMDGTQAVGALRRLNPNLPVIAISGVPSQRAELEASFGPRLRFLPKPFLVEKALSLVRELLDESVVPAGVPPHPSRK